MSVTAAPSELAAGSKLRALSGNTLTFRLGLHALAAELEPLTPVARLEVLERRADSSSILGYLAHALPEREAVWWACMCLRHVASADWPVPQHRALQAAQDWVRKPEEAARRAILPLAREAGSATPASFVARAGFTSRICRPDSVAAGLSVWQAVLKSFRPGVQDAFRLSALEIAHGGAGWIATETAA